MKKEKLFSRLALLGCFIFLIVGCTSQLGEDVLKIIEWIPALNVTGINYSDDLMLTFNYQIRTSGITANDILSSFGPYHTAGTPELSSATLTWSLDDRRLTISGIKGWSELELGGEAKTVDIAVPDGKIIDMFDNELSSDSILWRFQVSAQLTASLLYQKEVYDYTDISVSTAGDVNGDGEDDFIVGNCGSDPGGKENAGSADVYSGADGALLYQKYGLNIDDHFGNSVSTAGDINGDGKSDFIISAPHADPGGRHDAGSIYIYSGADGSLLYQKDGTVADNYFGMSVSGLTDLDGDGIPDFIVGAPLASPGGRANAGSAYVYSGADGSLLYQKDGSTAFDRLGCAVSAAGDVNGDGRTDFIIAGNNSGSGVGAAYVYSGSDGSSLYQKDGIDSDYFGNSVSTAGDVNGDGKDDFIVGAAFADPGGKSDAGSAYVYSGADGSLLYQKDGAAAGDKLGRGVATMGDVNQDGEDDFIIAAPYADSTEKIDAGSIYIYSGANGSLLIQKDGPAAAYELFGWSVANAGDVNGDNKPGFIVGARGTKKAYVYIIQ